MRILRAFILSTFFLLNGLCLYAQDGSTQIDDKNIDYKLLSSLFLNKLNKLRTEQGLNKLGSDSILAVAANDQAKYMNKTGVVGHTQTTKDKITPSERVLYYKGTNNRVGENCIQINLHVNYKDKKGATIIVNTYEEAATALFEGWKNSKPHYHNMITPYYDVQGIGFSYDDKTNKFYSTEVFGTYPYIPPKGFKVISDAWGVKEGPASLGFFSNDLANFIRADGDSLFLYYSILDYFNQYVKNSDDGIAVDIVAHEQFSCNHNNNLHGSPVFDGWMLEPVYYKNLLGRNKYPRKSNELLTYIGKIPKELKGRDIQFNSILINGKRSAGYSYPVYVETANLNMLELATYWDTISGKLIEDTLMLDINHYVEFQRGISNVSQAQTSEIKKRVSQYLKYITNIKIQTFSSIEGSEEGNIKLQKKRADNIERILSPLTNKSISIQTEATENWDAFFSQIKDTRFAYLKNYNKDVIREKLKDPRLLDSLDEFLSQERTAIISFTLNGKLKPNSANSDINRIAFQNAIQHKDIHKAWIIQSAMIRNWMHGKMNMNDFLDNDIPIRKECLPLLSNELAAKATNILYMYDPKFISFVKQVLDTGKDFPPLKLSYCVCAINYLAARNDTLLSNKKLEKLLDECSESSTLSKTIWKYYLDYYTAAAYYNWTEHKYNAMDSCLQGIQKYYPKAVLSDTDYIKLGKLFNMYYRTAWTIDMLYPVVKKGTKNEDLLFLFISTVPMFLNKVPKDEYISYLKQARTMNQARFCAWIGEENWQLLREDYIKELYCQKCNTH